VHEDADALVGTVPQEVDPVGVVQVLVTDVVADLDTDAAARLGAGGLGAGQLASTQLPMSCARGGEIESGTCGTTQNMSMARSAPAAVNRQPKSTASARTIWRACLGVGR